VLLDRSEQRIFQIASRRLKQDAVAMKDLVKSSIEMIDTLYQRKGYITGLPTGFTDLDHMLAGLQPADLIIVAGRPAMGKSSLALSLAEHVAVHQRLPVAIFSLEMSKEHLVQRLLCSHARINAHNVRTGMLSTSDWPKLTQAAGKLAEAPIFIDDSPGLTPMELRARARRLKREKGLGLILIDYLQLMESADSVENRATEISNITRALKGLAKELNVPVIAMSQLNRSVESRNDKRPVMSDLRESGAIEQDADVILFIYRDEVYNKDSAEKGTAEIIVAKQRNGPTGEVKLTFLGEYTRFENYTSAGYEGKY
jgi:replicative DNA helicase